MFSPNNKDQRVFVLGEVNKQSAIPITDRMTLLQAIAEAGGFTHDANRKTILVMRGNLSEPDIMKIDAGRIDLANNMPLKRGDIIYVASSSFADVERVAVRLSHILEPFYNLARSVVWGDAAVQVLEGKRSFLIMPDTE